MNSERSGRACATALARAGSAIAVRDLQQADADGAATASGVRLTRRSAASPPDSVPIDHLINNAARAVCLAADFPIDKYQPVCGIELADVFCASKAVWPHRQ